MHGLQRSVLNPSAAATTGRPVTPLSLRNPLSTMVGVPWVGEEYGREKGKRGRGGMGGMDMAFVILCFVFFQIPVLLARAGVVALVPENQWLFRASS